jgi:drug/metabolite transporter (DMT)-like permease
LSTIVFVAVVAAAALHAVWNALAKGGRDKHLSMAAVVLGHAPIALAVLPFVPAPAPESWSYVACGVALHVGYQLFLITAYRLGDLTHVYPIARGTAPLLVAGVSTLFLGVALAPVEVAAVLTIAAGIMSLSFVRQGDGARNARASLLASVTGCFIACYSLNDGTGARLSGSPVGFYAWEAIGNAVIFTALMAWTQPRLLPRLLTEARPTFIIGGSASFLAYALVVWAFTQAPIALVTALRETSIVFALIIGVWFLRERLDLAKVLSTFVTMLGAVLLRFAKP